MLNDNIRKLQVNCIQLQIIFQEKKHESSPVILENYKYYIHQNIKSVHKAVKQKETYDNLDVIHLENSLNALKSLNYDNLDDIFTLEHIISFLKDDLGLNQ